MIHQSVQLVREPTLVMNIMGWFILGCEYHWLVHPAARQNIPAID